MNGGLDALHGSILRALDPTALEAMRLSPIETSDVPSELARLRRLGSLDLLPFASDRGGWTLGFQLAPDRPWYDSRVIAVQGEGRLYIASSARRFPPALVTWLWIHCPEAKRNELFDGSARLLAGLERRHTVSVELRTYLEAGPVDQIEPYSMDSPPATEGAWQLAHSGHPLVGIRSHIGHPRNAQDAADRLSQLAHSERHLPPEVEALLVTTLAAAGRPIQVDQVIRILSTRAWSLDRFVVGGWRLRGQGVIPEWDATLRTLGDGSPLTATPLAPLVGHARAFSGEDREGPEVLAHAGRNLEALGDLVGAVSTWLNGATVSRLGLYHDDANERELRRFIEDPAAMHDHFRDLLRVSLSVPDAAA